MSRLRKLMGRWRLFWRFCPECNSDGPELDSCRVCDGYRSHETTLTPWQQTKERWWRRFAQARCAHGVPMECDCSECKKWIRRHLGRMPQNPRR